MCVCCYAIIKSIIRINKIAFSESFDQIPSDLNELLIVPHRNN